MKRLSIALAALGLSASAFAAYPAATNPTEVSVPQLPGGFYIGATGYYLQASDTNGDLDYVSVTNLVAPPFVSKIKSVDPGYDWGWGVNLGYIFPGTGNNIEASYFHLDTDDTDSVGTLNSAVAFTLPLFDTNGNLEVPNFASGKAEYDIDQVDVTAGQYIDVGCRLILHPNVGVRWASLDRELKTVFQESVFPLSEPSVADEVFADEESDFSGIGPLVGIDASYYIGWGIGAVAHFDSALLVGDIDDKVNSTFIERSTFSGPVLATVAGELKTESTRRIVPVVDAKLGADWTYVFNNTTNSDLTLEVGYQVSKYFNAVDSLGGTVASASAAGVPVGGAAGSHFTSDVGLNGPYVNLTFHA